VVAKKLIGHAERKLDKMRRAATGRRKQQLSLTQQKGGFNYSLDKATYHTAADLNDCGVDAADVQWQATAAGDMHGPIEHRWGDLDRAVFEFMIAHPDVTDMETLKKVIVDYWEAITPESVQQDFENLVEVWRGVRDAKGGYTTHKLW
jgi:hypothetical protein